MGIGLANPGDYHANANALVIDGGITLANTAGGSIYFADSATGTGEYIGQINYNHGSEYLQFVVNDSEAMRINSSQSLLIGPSGAPATTLTAAGAATFAQQVTSGGDPYNGGFTGSKLGTGVIQVSNSSSNFLWTGHTTGTATPTSSITAAGAATFAGDVTAGAATFSGDVSPDADATYDLGSATKRWANIYSADLQLSNEGSANDVDGTWGQYTIQEGEDDLFLINRRSGKKYKFNLTEV